MAEDKLAGHLGLVSPTLTGALDLLVKHAPKARTLALRYEDRPEAFERLVAVEGGAAFLPDGAPNPDYQRKLGAFLGRARETLPPYGIPLMAQRSIAIDTNFVPLGTPVYLSTTMPASSQALKCAAAATARSSLLRK